MNRIPTVKMQGTPQSRLYNGPLLWFQIDVGVEHKKRAPDLGPLADPTSLINQNLKKGGQGQMVGILLLNTSFEPLYILNHQRATTLLLGGQALPVQGEPAAITMRSPSLTIKVPMVIQLRRYVNVPRRDAGWSKAGVLQRDAFRCIYCGKRPGEKQGGRIVTRRDFNVDHIIPRSKGGGNTWGNTACACQRCNSRKGGRTPTQAGMKLRWEPKRARTNYLVVRGEVPMSWKKYIELST